MSESQATRLRNAETLYAAAVRRCEAYAEEIARMSEVLAFTRAHVAATDTDLVLMLHEVTLQRDALAAAVESLEERLAIATDPPAPVTDPGASS